MSAVEIHPARLTAVNRSGTIAAGGVAQQLMAYNGERHGWSIQNQSAEDLYIASRGAAGTGNATANYQSLKIPSGAYFEAPFITPEALSIIGATTASAFNCLEW